MGHPLTNNDNMTAKEHRALVRRAMTPSVGSKAERIIAGRPQSFEVFSITEEMIFLRSHDPLRTIPNHLHSFTPYEWKRAVRKYARQGFTFSHPTPTT